MEKITKLAYMYEKMQANKFVLSAKSNAKAFLTYCIMLDIKVSFELVENKIKFTLK